MKRSTRYWLIAVGSVALACAGAYLYSGRGTEERAAAGQRAIDAKFDRIRHDLPVGSGYDNVLSYLRTHTDSYYEEPGQAEGQVVYVDLGSRPSAVWYCSRYSGYAKLSFVTSPHQSRTTDSLDRIALEMRGVDCL